MAVPWRPVQGGSSQGRTCSRTCHTWHQNDNFSLQKGHPPWTSPGTRNPLLPQEHPPSFVAAPAKRDRLENYPKISSAPIALPCPHKNTQDSLRSRKANGGTPWVTRCSHSESRAPRTPRPTRYAFSRSTTQPPGLTEVCTILCFVSAMEGKVLPKQLRQRHGWQCVSHSDCRSPRPSRWARYTRGRMLFSFRKLQTLLCRAVTTLWPG